MYRGEFVRATFVAVTSLDNGMVGLAKGRFWSDGATQGFIGKMVQIQCGLHLLGRLHTIIATGISKMPTTVGLSKQRILVCLERYAWYSSQGQLLDGVFFLAASNDICKLLNANFSATKWFPRGW